MPDMLLSAISSLATEWEADTGAPMGKTDVMGGGSLAVASDLPLTLSEAARVKGG